MFFCHVSFSETASKGGAKTVVDREGIDGLIRERSLDVRFANQDWGFAHTRILAFGILLYYIYMYIYTYIYISTYIYIYYIPFGVEVLI